MVKNNAKKLGKSHRFGDLVAIMRTLLGEKGCRWDKSQNHKTLIKYLREESAEVEDAIRREDWNNLKEELGDLMLQIVFHSVLAERENLFDIKDVLREINSKLVRRHPHVFGGKKAETPAEVLENWNRIKLREKGKGK